HGRVAENVNPLVEWIGQDAVGAVLSVQIDRLDEGPRLEIPHRHGAAAGEAMAGFYVDGSSVRSGIRNLARIREFVEVENRHPARQRLIALDGAARNIQPTTIRVSLDVVESAQASDFRRLQDFVWPG